MHRGGSLIRKENSMSAHQVVVVGSANADLVLDVDHRPAAGETVLGTDIVITPGGKGANQAVAAARLGCDVAFLGCVGDDAHGEMLRASMRGAGVDLSGLRVVGASTGSAIIMVTPDGENSIIVSPSANRQVSCAMIDELEQVWAGARVVVVQLEVPVETVGHLAHRAHATGTRVLINAAPAAALPAEVLAVADPLVVNDSEAAFLLARADATLAVPRTDPRIIAAALLALGPRSVVVTLGVGGAVFIERDTVPRQVRARSVQALDTTGAGDAFVGALAVHLAGGASLAAAVERATDVAAISVTRRGAQNSYPTLEEVEQ
jgi:ribokinase